MNTAKTIPFTNVAYVSKNGSDVKGSIGGYPFLTITGAINKIKLTLTTGVLISVQPGSYDESIIIPDNTSIRGVSAGTCFIRRLNVIADTTLITMGNTTRLEDVTLQLTSSQHVTCTGILFPETTTVSGRLRTIVLTVDNSTATSSGSSNVYGIRSTGTGQPLKELTTTCRASTVVVRSSGGGTKRGILLDTGANYFHGAEISISCKRTADTTGLGSYIGAETNVANSLLTVYGRIIQGDTADISQTLGTIEIAQVNLLNANANGKTFTTIYQAPRISWGDPGSLPQGSTKFYYPGTYPVTTNEIFLTFTDKTIVKSLVVRARISPGVGKTDTWTIRKNGVDTLLTVSLTGTETFKNSNTVSITFNALDTISLKVVIASNSLTTDTQIQIDRL